MNKLTLADLDLDRHQVLVRVDFNVPLSERPPTQPFEDVSYAVADDTRIRAALPTVRAIMEAGGRAILLSHLGRPKGQPNSSLSLAPVAEHLGGLLDGKVRFCNSTTGPLVDRTLRSMPDGTVLLLENTRFHPGETRNDADFAKDLAQLGDVFVNDAFGTAHRAHASNVGVAQRIPKAAAGLLLERELRLLGDALHHPTPPVVALLGGAKVSDKIGVIRSLAAMADHILIGGAMSYTFLKARGFNTGASLVEDDWVDDALNMFVAAAGKLKLPVDHIVSTDLRATAEARTVSRDIPAGFMGLDIGPATVERYLDILRRANTIIWNGPMGVFEKPAFAAGTHAMASGLAEVTRKNAITVVGGGDSVAAVHRAGLASQITHVSTGGGAMLQFLEGRDLPGVSVLTDRS
ncbi:MAG: phosphoglycerate kinase [Bacteroidota bacterium]|nr:phosphoglycerate kinase [Bacteroidota bacterium]